MAEVVERNVEDSLNEVVHIRRAKLFNEEELRDIVRRRRRHEYSIQKRNKRITDYYSYIATELGILRLVNLRRHKTKDFRFTDEIEKSIITRLVRLYRLGRHMAVARLWERILQVHGRTDARLWAAAASFHMNEGARAQARAVLAELKTEISALQVAEKNVDILRKNPTCTQEEAALRLETIHLSRLRESMDHSVHLTWDRVLLRGIREARRLLTQGLAFNETSTFLLLELLKLEGSAADFFAKRVATRQQFAEKKNGNKGGDFSTVGNRKKLGTRRKKIEEKEEEAVTFMKEVTEDVDFVKTGGAFNLVLERFLTFPTATSTDLLEALEISKKLSSFADKGIVEKLSTRQRELCATEMLEQEKLKKSISGELNATATVTADIVVAAGQRNEELKRILDIDGVDAALTAWNVWYHPPVGSNDLLQVKDPSADPRWMCLLTTRLYILMVAKMLYKSTQLAEKKGNVSEAILAYQEFRLKQEARVRDSRNLMDTLAAFNWGSKVPEFWLLYMEFEEKLGDCSRLPSLRWRAEKCLEDAPRLKFINALVVGGQKEFL